MIDKQINDKRIDIDRRITQLPENEPIAIERRAGERRDDESKRS